VRIRPPGTSPDQWPSGPARTRAGQGCPRLPGASLMSDSSGVIPRQELLRACEVIKALVMTYIAGMTKSLNPKQAEDSVSSLHLQLGDHLAQSPLLFFAKGEGEVQAALREVMACHTQLENGTADHLDAEVDRLAQAGRQLQIAVEAIPQN